LFAEKTPVWLRIFLALTVGVMGIAVIFSALPDASALAMVFALAGPLAMGWHMVWQLRGLDINDPAKCMQLFRVNRDTGMIPLFFFAIALFV
jgi:4-hydroxybenzoate polyprenyltransferase